MAVKLMLRAAALAVTAAAIAVPAGTAPASAATEADRATAAAAAGQPLPSGTFRIQDSKLKCADALPPGANDRGRDDLVFLDPCDPLNLDEQYTYNRQTEQVLSVGQPGRCLDTADAPYVKYLPCNSTRRSQKFTRIEHGKFRGQYQVTAYRNDRPNQFRFIGDYPLLRALPTGTAGHPPVEWLFRFPLV